MTGLLGSPVGRNADFKRRVDDYVLLREENAAGVEPGALVAMTWTTRQVDTIRDDEAGIVKRLASGVFTIEAGTYLCKAFCGAFAVEGFSTRLYDTLRSSVLVVGQGQYGTGSYGAMVFSWTEGVFTVYRTTTVAFQCRSSSGNGNTYTQGPSAGARATTNENEVLAVVELLRIRA